MCYNKDDLNGGVFMCVKAYGKFKDEVLISDIILKSNQDMSYDEVKEAAHKKGIKSSGLVRQVLNNLKSSGYISDDGYKYSVKNLPHF